MAADNRGWIQLWTFIFWQTADKEIIETELLNTGLVSEKFEPYLQEALSIALPKIKLSIEDYIKSASKISIQTPTVNIVDETK